MAGEWREHALGDVIELKRGYDLPQQDRLEELPPGLTVFERLIQAQNDLNLERYQAEARAAAALDRAGFPEPDTEARSLSGGWRKRLAILAQVVRQPDLLLFDEPTNHLDFEGVLWLESFLNGVDFPFLVVTHDRRFLERVCNRIIELNKAYPEGYFSSEGNYSRFLENREMFLEAQSSREDSVRNITRGEIEWLRKGPKARTTKQKARIDRAGALIEELSELEVAVAVERVE